MYQFYVKLDGHQYGPYTATQIVNMELPGDTEVMEASIGTWELSNNYPWSDLVMKESGAAISPSGSIVAGNVGSYVPTGVSQVTTYPPQSNSDDKPSVALNIISFLIPIVGWILYFALKKTGKAKACSKWAWIGFIVSFILNLILSK